MNFWIKRKKSPLHLPTKMACKRWDLLLDSFPSYLCSPTIAALLLPLPLPLDHILLLPFPLAQLLPLNLDHLLLLPLPLPLAQLLPLPLAHLLLLPLLHPSDFVTLTVTRKPQTDWKDWKYAEIAQYQCPGHLTGQLSPEVLNLSSAKYRHLV